MNSYSSVLKLLYFIIFISKSCITNHFDNFFNALLGFVKVTYAVMIVINKKKI